MCLFFRSNTNIRTLFLRKVGYYYPIMKLISFLWTRLVSKFTLNFITFDYFHISYILILAVFKTVISVVGISKRLYFVAHHLYSTKQIECILKIILWGTNKYLRKSSTSILIKNSLKVFIFVCSDGVPVWTSKSFRWLMVA